jgi:hypothetical protein
MAISKSSINMITTKNKKENPVPEIAPKHEIRKKEIILIKRCPANRFAKSRIAKLNTRDSTDSVSTNTSKGNKSKGTPDGINKNKNCTPFCIRAQIKTSIRFARAKANVISS